MVGYDEALAVYRDDERYSAVNAATGPFGLPAFKVDGAQDRSADRGVPRLGPYGALSLQDPPSHANTGALLMGMITPKRLKENEDFMWRLSYRQIDEFIDRGIVPCGGRLRPAHATLVIADLLGVPGVRSPELPQADRHAPGQLDGSSQQVGNNPLEHRHRVLELHQRCRAEPRSDVLTGLAQAKYPDGTIPEVVEVVTIAAFLFRAGQDTTVRLLAAALRFPAEDPELQQTLRKEPIRIPDFLEEVLRLEGPVKATSASRACR